MKCRPSDFRSLKIPGRFNYASFVRASSHVWMMKFLIITFLLSGRHFLCLETTIKKEVQCELERTTKKNWKGTTTTEDSKSAVEKVDEDIKFLMADY